MVQILVPQQESSSITGLYAECCLRNELWHIRGNTLRHLLTLPRQIYSWSAGIPLTAEWGSDFLFCGFATCGVSLSSGSLRWKEREHGKADFFFLRGILEMDHVYGHELWLDLTTRCAGRCNLVVCTMMKENGFLIKASSLLLYQLLC